MPVPRRLLLAIQQPGVDFQLFALYSDLNLNAIRLQVLMRLAWVMGAGQFGGGSGQGARPAPTLFTEDGYAAGRGRATGGI